MSCGAQSSKRWDDTTFGKKFSFTSSDTDIDFAYWPSWQGGWPASSQLTLTLSLSRQGAAIEIVLNLKNARPPLLPACLSNRNEKKTQLWKKSQTSFLLSPRLGTPRFRKQKLRCISHFRSHFRNHFGDPPPSQHRFSIFTNYPKKKTYLSLRVKFDQISPPHFCKTCFGTSGWFWHAKTLDK